MDLMLPRLNALRDSEDEAAIAGAEYRHSTRLSGVGVSLKDDAKALGMGITVKDDANELDMGVIDSADVVMSSQDKVIVGYWLVRARLMWRSLVARIKISSCAVPVFLKMR